MPEEQSTIPSASRKRKYSPSEDSTIAIDVLNKTRKKPTACTKCHARKVKCPGGYPCPNCQQAGCPQDCTYPVREQKVTVPSSYIEKLLAENKRLREQSVRDEPHHGGIIEAIESSTEHSEAARNPLLDDRSWFFPLSNSQMPVHIGEAADTSFATRLRQAIAEDPTISHIPRQHYVTDARIFALSEAECPWPTLSRARLLIRFAMEVVGSCYHCFRKSDVHNRMQHHYRNLSAPNPMFACKLWALFALGEVYSCRTSSTSEEDFPGLAYFSQATKMLSRLRERPQFDTIEILLLLSLYSLLMNRRYSAYFLASSAVRMSVIMGMHQAMPDYQLPDRAAREHRARIWWTAYTFDRLWASKMGHPVSIQDEDISVDLPSDTGISDADAADFLAADYMNASIRLARISRDIISSIYNRKTTNIPFSQRVQKALGDLRGWVGALPKHLQIDSREGERPLARNVQLLHLSFNQYVIQATRPILLHVFQTHKELWAAPHQTPELKQAIGETALALAEACIRCARHSHRLLSESWIDGSFAIFDYTYAQYLFSAATILAISHLSIGQNNENDKDNFESANLFLEQLKRNGNFAATELCQHFDALRVVVRAHCPRSSTGDHFDGANGANSALNFPRPSMTTEPFTRDIVPHGTDSQPMMTAEMALAEPSVQDFLSQADLDLRFLDTHMQDSHFQSLYVGLQDIEWGRDINRRM
ncbi:fungal-specific transcription factor domain-containing protein [Pseudomassariella vexata]|uniref:Fungal-specific transcription factor domain-domain-containing protein n=1 Tax=Pseudomassariella vexata TaxID=1141098 RepID=A0A1Y2DZX7_9PEZI|nr:fungal-specific transcription factor domain-containing protein [Pseudomassariella vexata]ORY64838.1 fungal-specific transcription factor domain-domain-containing protein [Pseudomassariella vexata]